MTVDAKPWLEQVEESQRGHEALSEVENVNDLAKRFINIGDELKTVKGDLEGRIKLLGENPTDAERNEFYSKLGRPERPEDYGFKKPENLPEGMPYSEELVTAYRGMAHKLGLSDSAAKELFDFYNNTMTASHNAQLEAEVKAQEDGVKALKEAWGAEYEKNTEVAVRTQEKLNEILGGDELKKFLEEYGAGDHPALVKLFHKIGTAIADDKFELGSPAGPKTETGPRAMFPNSPTMPGGS